MLSIVHIMQQNSLVAKDYSKTQKVRKTTIKSNIESLNTANYLSVKDDQTLSFLASTISLVNRFWISEAAISFKRWSEHDQVIHYLGLLCHLLKPYATAKGKTEIREFEDSL